MTDVTQLHGNWQAKLDTVGDVVQGVDAIEQSIRTIVSTQRGELPLTPTFGIDWLSIIDRPVHLVAPLVVREVTLALGRHETRVVVRRIEPMIEGSTIRARITWTPRGTDSERITEVPIA